MKTITLIEHVDLPASAQAVWDVIADYRRDVQWRTGVTCMVPTPADQVRVGTTTVEELRLGGKTWRNAGRVIAVTPGHHFSWRTTDGAVAHGSRTVEILGPERSRVRLELNVTPHGAERLMAPVLARMLRRNLRRDLAQLRALLAEENELSSARAAPSGSGSTRGSGRGPAGPDAASPGGSCRQEHRRRTCMP